MRSMTFLVIFLGKIELNVLFFADKKTAEIYLSKRNKSEVGNKF